METENHHLAASRVVFECGGPMVTDSDRCWFKMLREVVGWHTLRSLAWSQSIPSQGNNHLQRGPWCRYGRDTGIYQSDPVITYQWWVIQNRAHLMQCAEKNTAAFLGCPHQECTIWICPPGGRSDRPTPRVTWQLVKTALFKILEDMGHRNDKDVFQVGGD